MRTWTTLGGVRCYTSLVGYYWKTILSEEIVMALKFREIESYNEVEPSLGHCSDVPTFILVHEKASYQSSKL